MAIIQQKERELRYARQGNLQQEAAVTSNYMRDMIRAYGVDVRYYKLKCPYPEVFKPILDLNNLTMHAYGYDPTPEYEVETPLIVYWQYEDNNLILNAYGVQPNRVAKCWIDATDFAIAFAKTLSEYKEYKVDSDTDIVLEFENLLDFMDSVSKIYLNFESKIFDGECNPVFTEPQIKYLCELIDEHTHEGSSSSIESIDLPDSNIPDGEAGAIATKKAPDEIAQMGIPCRLTKHGTMRLETPHVVPEFWKGKKFEDFVDDTYDSYLRFVINSIDINADGSFKMYCSLTGAIIYYDLNVVSKYCDKIRPQAGDVISLPLYNHGDTISRFEIVQVVDESNENYMNPFLRRYVYECDLRNYVSSGEQVPEERDAENKYRKLNELINFSTSEAGRKISLYKDHEEDIYGGYDKVSGLDGAVLASNEKKGVTVNKFKEREDGGEPPSTVSEESIIAGEVSFLHIADLIFPAPLSLVLATNVTDDWTRLMLINGTSPEPLSELPWQHYLRCNDDTLILRLDNRIYRLASILEECALYDDSPVLKPRRLKRNVYAQRGGFNDQPFNVVDSEESQLDLGNYAETLTGPSAGEEYKGPQIKNSGISRLIWRNTRSYMDVTLMKNPQGKDYYQLAVKFKGDRRNRRFPLAVCDA